MAIPASSEPDKLVLTSTRTNVADAIPGLLNAIIAKSLPDRLSNGDRTAGGCDRSTSVTAQAGSIQAALTELIETLLDAMTEHEGGIRRFDLHGLMTGPDRCTVWGQACVERPVPHRSLALDTLMIHEAPGAVEITATLRVTDRAR